MNNGHQRTSQKVLITLYAKVHKKDEKNSENIHNFRLPKEKSRTWALKREDLLLNEWFLALSFFHEAGSKQAIQTVLRPQA